MNYNKTLKFNMVDILLIIISVIVTSVIVIFLFKDGTDHDFSSQKSIYCTFQLKNIHSSHYDKIQRDDAVYDTKTGEKIGIVTNVIYSNSYENKYNSENQAFEKISYTDLYDVQVVICISAKENQLKQYTIGKELKLNVPSYAFTGSITSIDETLPDIDNIKNINVDMTQTASDEVLSAQQ